MPAPNVLMFPPPTITYPTPAQVSVQVTDSIGNPVSGIVNLSVDSANPITQTLVGGSTTFVVNGLGPGNHNLTVTYPAQGGFSQASTSSSFWMFGMTSALSMNIINAGQNAQVTVTATGAVAGNIGLYSTQFISYQNVTFVGQILPTGNVPVIAVFYDQHILNATVNGAQIAASCLARLAADYATVQGFFGPSVAQWPVTTLIIIDETDNLGQDQGGMGAFHLSRPDPLIYASADILDARTTSALFVAELVEVGEGLQLRGWDAGSSNGEALSRMLPETMYPGIMEGWFRGRTNPVQYWTYGTVQRWIEIVPHPNWVDTTVFSDQVSSNEQAAEACGCGVLFLWWLHNSPANGGFGFGLPAIVQAGAGASGGNVGTFAGTFQALTGRNTGWTEFSNAVNARWPNSVFTPNDNMWLSLTPTDPGNPPAIPPIPSGNPTGSVSLFKDGVLAATQTLDSSGQTVFTLTALSSGSHALRATYGGQGVFATAPDANGTLLVSGGGSTPKFHRTSSTLGTRSGSRQEESYAG